MSFTKLKDISHRLCMALGELDYFFLIRSTLYFLNDFKIHEKVFDRAN